MNSRARMMPKTGSYLVAKLGLYLIKVNRQLLIAADLAAGQIGNDFFVGRADTELPVMTVMKAKQFRAILVPTTRFLPQFRRLHRRHEHLLGSCAVHFLSNDGFDIAQHSQAHR